MNDYRAGSDFPTISTAFEILIKKIRYKYPNARIWYVSMAYNTNAENGPALLKIHNTRCRWYKYLAAKNGVILIKGVRRILPDIPKDCFESDGFHPGQGAREIIAEALSKRITQVL